MNKHSKTHKKKGKKTRKNIGGLPRRNPRVNIDLSTKPIYDINHLEIGRRYIITVVEGNGRREENSGRVMGIYHRPNPADSSVILGDVIINGSRVNGQVSIVANIIERITGENYNFVDIPMMHPHLTRSINSYLGGRKSKKTKKSKKKGKKTRRRRRSTKKH